MQTSYAVNQKLASLFSLARKDSNRCRSTCWIAGLMTNIQEDSKISSFFFFFLFLSSFLPFLSLSAVLHFYLEMLMVKVFPSQLYLHLESGTLLVPFIVIASLF